MIRNQCLWETLVSPFSKTQACTTLADKKIYLFHVRNYFVVFLFFIFFISCLSNSSSHSLFFLSFFCISHLLRRALSTDFILCCLGLSSICKTRFLPFRKNLRSSGRKLSWIFSLNIEAILLYHRARLFFCQIWPFSCSVSFLVFSHMLHCVLKRWYINVVD